MKEKSHGMKFAEQQLLRHGWKQGKGLGRDEDGISEAVKVKVKCDKGGVGHREGEHFSFHWWDHVFNKASSSLQVASHHNGVQLRKMEEEEEGGGERGRIISNKKPRKAALEKSKLYGCFVKSATLLSGREQPELKGAESEASSSDKDDEMLDLSSATRLSDSDLMRVCGGRTAHKGARHGLTMSAKLARLEQQEAEFMAKYKKSQSESSSSASSSQVEKPPKKKKKKKKSAETESPEKKITSPEEEEKKKKKKKKKKAEDQFILQNEENTKKRKNKSDKDSPESRPEKKRRKRRKSKPEEEEEERT